MSRLSGEGLNGDNDEAISEQVSNAWRVVGKRLLTEGYDPALVTETMLTVALKSWVGLRTRPDPKPSRGGGWWRPTARPVHDTSVAGRLTLHARSPSRRRACPGCSFAALLGITSPLWRK